MRDEFSLGDERVSPARKMPFRSTVGHADKYTTNLRYEFFRAVDEVAPELAGEMVEAIGPTFERLAEGNLHSFVSIAREEESFSAVWQEWGEQYGLYQDSWILDHVLSILPAFLKDPPAEFSDLKILPSFSAVPVLSVYLVPGHQITPPGPYRVDLETRADYDKRISKYADLIERIARSTGWVLASDKPQAQRHLRWLVRFQVKGETVAAIVPKKGTNQRNVEKALKEMASLIGLTRRTLP